MRPFDEANWPAVWAMQEPMLRAGETFPHDSAISKDEAQPTWVDQNQVVMVARNAAEAVVGTYDLRSNSLARLQIWLCARSY